MTCKLPPVAAPTREDELWRHTCFEAFLRTLPGATYYEFNFAPSTQWAAYRFASYRSRMRAATAMNTPMIAVQSSPDRFTLRPRWSWKSSRTCRPTPVCASASRR